MAPLTHRRSDGKVSVAAAFAINIASTTSQASLPDGLTIVAGHGLSLRSSANTDGTVLANGSAVGAAKAGIGAAVALNVVTIVNQASVGADTITANGLDLEATMTNVGGDTTHTFGVDAIAGAGSGNVGVAGAVAINIVSDTTEAIVAAGAVVSAGTGNITLIAQNLRADVAAALGDAALGSGTSIGVGASVALNVLTTNITEAEVANGATLSGAGGTVTLEATSAEAVTAMVTAGSAGTKVAVSPAVGITLSFNTTTASLGSGSGTVSVTGAVTIAATHTGSSTITGNATAASNKVAVGAIIAVNVVEDTTTAALDRSIAGGSVTVAATTTDSADAEVIASAKGTSKNDNGSGSSNSDGQASNQLNGTPATKGQSSSLPSSSNTVNSANGSSTSQTGSSGSSGGGGGVGVGAAVTVNWLTDANTASIANGLTVSGSSGPVNVLATNETNATGKATGFAGKFSGSSTNIAAAIGLDVAQITNTATVGTSDTISGAGLAVEAVTPAGAQDNFIVWGMAGAGGSEGNDIAGSVGVQVLIITTTATVGQGSHLTSTQGLTMAATAPIGLQNLAAAGALTESGGSAVGVAIAVNVLEITTKAYVDSAPGTATTTSVNAAGPISITSTSALLPLAVTSMALAKALGLSSSVTADLPTFTLPPVTSVAVSGALAGEESAVGGSVIVDVFTFVTQAYLADGVQVNQTTAGGANQSITISASDNVSVFNVAGSIALSGGDGAGGAAIIVEVVEKDVRAFIGRSAAVNAGGAVSVLATSGDSYLEIAAQLAASSGDFAAGGAIIVLVINQGTISVLDGPAQTYGTRAYIDGGPGAGTTVNAGGTVTIEATEAAPASNPIAPVVTAPTAVTVVPAVAVQTTAPSFQLYAVDLDVADSAAIGASAAILIRTSVVDAFVGQGDTITADGTSGTCDGSRTGLCVTATQGANITLLAIGGSAGGDAGVAGSATVDVLNDTTDAYLDQGVTVTATGTAASSTAGIAVAASDLTTIMGISGAVAIGGDAGVGAGVDAEIIGKDTEAWMGVGDNATVNGDVTVDATSSETGTSIAVGGAFAGDVAVTVNAGVSVYTITTKAYVGGICTAAVLSYANCLGYKATINAGGSARVAANEQTTLNVIAGNIAASGGVAVGAAGAVPVLSKTTTAFIGDDSVVNAQGNDATGLSVDTGSVEATVTDTRFTPSTAITSGDIVDLGYDAGFTEGQQVLYDDGGGTPIVGLMQGTSYYVHIVSETKGVDEQVLLFTSRPPSRPSTTTEAPPLRPAAG